MCGRHRQLGKLLRSRIDPIKFLNLGIKLIPLYGKLLPLICECSDKIFLKHQLGHGIFPFLCVCSRRIRHQGALLREQLLLHFRLMRKCHELHTVIFRYINMAGEGFRFQEFGSDLECSLSAFKFII